MFFTPYLKTEKFKNLFKKIESKEKKKENILEYNKAINYKFLEEISFEFEKESQNTLFGLDFLYNKDSNTYSIIDCNISSMQGMKGTVRNYLKKHLLYYYKKFLAGVKYQ